MAHTSVETRKQLSERVAGKTRSAAGSPLKAIRKKCLECAADSRKEVALCPDPQCSLWPFRYGERPETSAAKGKQMDPKHLAAGSN